MKQSQKFKKIHVEISACARKSGKNEKIGHLELGIEIPGSTGRQILHGHHFRNWHAFLHLQLRGFVKM